MLGKRSIGHLGVRRRWQGACSCRLGSLEACAEDVSQALGTAPSSLHRRQVRRRSGGIIEFELAIQTGG